MVSRNSRKAGPACWLLYISSSVLWPDRQYRTPTLYLLDNPCSSNRASASSAAVVPSLRQPSWTSGATSSRSSLVGGRPCGLMPRASSGTVPRNVSNSDVRTITRYWLTSLRMLMATGPNCSSMPNQFWCSRPATGYFRFLYAPSVRDTLSERPDRRNSRQVFVLSSRRDDKEWFSSRFLFYSVCFRLLKRKFAREFNFFSLIGVIAGFFQQNQA